MSGACCTLAVRGLDCPTEAATLRRALEGAPGVLELGFDYGKGHMIVRHDPSATGPQTLIRQVADRAGMSATLVKAIEPPSRPSLWSRHGHWLLTAASGLALLAGVVLDLALAAPSGGRIAYALAVVLGGAPLLPRAVAALRVPRLDMHVLMTIAVIGAVALGQWDEAATVAFLFGLSEALEAMSLERARRAVRSLLDVTPETAERLDSRGDVTTIPAAEVQVGDRLRVRAGMRIPVDGRVVAGRSSVDQKAITGESVPVTREVGDEVFAGTVNGEGALEIEATKPLGDAVVSRIVEQVRAAQAGRTPVERTIERFAEIYTPAVVLLAVLVMIVPPLILGGGSALWRDWIVRGLVVLVTACPCALVIATPVAVVSALTAAARRGILVKSGQYLEAFARLKVLALDKTGTLTLGEPTVVDVVPATDREGADVLRFAAALGERGSHVLGRAIARHARGLQLEIPEAHDYQAIPGLGASGRIAGMSYAIGSHRYIDESQLCTTAFHEQLDRAETGVGTAVVLTAERGPLGFIRLADRPRPEAAQVLAELHAMGLKTVMLTGDNPPTAALVADDLGIADYRAGLLPAEKANAIAELSKQFGATGMVGDGVNDAPALAAASVSVALGGISSGAALEAADIVLMADDLTGLPWLTRHSRRTIDRIRQNITLAVASKLAVLVLAILGFANLWLAIAADLGVSLIVVANALRLLRGR